MATVSYEGVKAAINEPGTYVIDVRNKDELLKTGVIPGAINIPRPELEDALKMSENDFKTAFNRDLPTKDTVLIFSCQSGRRAELAYQWALASGYKNSKYYAGSWNEWAAKEGLSNS